jgi:hypothetical protein
MLFRHPSSRKNTRAARLPRTPRTILRWRPTFDILEDRVVPTLNFVLGFQPVSTATGQLMAQIQVKSDAAASVPVTLSLSALTTSGTPILGGTVTQNTDAASHIATFTNLFVYGGSGKSVTLTASSGLDIIVSTTFEVKPGGDHLYVSSTIPTTMAGASLGSIDVVELDAGGSVESSDSQTVVQLFLQDNPGGAQFRNATSGAAISTPITSKLVNGKATFTGVALDKVGIGYTLGVVAANASPNNTTRLPGTSNVFVVTAGAPVNLTYLVQPTYTDTNPSNDQGQVFTINKYLSNRGVANTWTGVVVGVVDKFGNPVIKGVTGQVTISTDGKFSDKVTADDLTKDIDPNTGVAVFDNLQWRRNVEHLVRITQDSDTVQVLDNVADLAVGMTIGNPELDPFKAYFLPGTTILQIDMSNPSNLLLKLSKKAQNSTDAKGIGAVPFNFQKDGGFTLTATPVGLKDTNGPITAQAVMSAPFDVGVDRRRALQFVQGFALPTTAQVRSKLPVVKVQVVNAFGQVITADNSDVIRIASGGITGTLYRTVVNGVATFDDLAVGGLALKLANGTDAPPLVVNFEFVNQALSPVGGTKAPQLQLTAGPADHLRIVNPDRLVGMDNMITAGGYVRDSKGNPIEIDVVDQDNNLITTDTTTVVSIGLLPNEGRGPVYVGNGPVAGKIDYSKTVQKNPNDSFDFQAVKTVVGGKAIFNNLYIDFAGQNYILSAGTTNFVNHAGADTAPFMVVADKASHLEFVNEVNTTNALARIVSFNPAQWLPGQYKAMNSVVVAALDPFGNVDPNFLDAVKLDLQPLTGTGTLKNSNILKGKDPLAVVAFGGFAVFNTFYITDMGSYTLKASDPDNDSVTATGPSNSFMVTASSLSSDAIGNPVITISSIGNQKSGTPFEVTVEIHKDFFPKEHYLGNAVVNLELRDKDGNPVPEKVATFKYNPEAKQDADGNFKYTVTIALGAGVTQGQFTILALLNLKAKTKLSNPPFTDPIDPVFGTPTGTSTDPVAYGLGSLDTNYDAISSFPVYNGNFPPGGRPFPPVVGFDPAQVTDNTLPALQQPNVADGFDQVAQSSKWWSSLIFSRTKVAATDVKTPQDSQRNELFALTAGPLAAMVNDNGAHQEGNFAGLGLTYLTDSALFVQPSKAFNDPPPPNVPASRRRGSIPRPRAPSAGSTATTATPTRGSTRTSRSAWQGSRRTARCSAIRTGPSRSTGKGRTRVRRPRSCRPRWARACRSPISRSRPPATPARRPSSWSPAPRTISTLPPK